MKYNERQNFSKKSIQGTLQKHIKEDIWFIGTLHVYTTFLTVRPTNEVLY